LQQDDIRKQNGGFQRILRIIFCAKHKSTCICPRIAYSNHIGDISSKL
jgi:hypothetical protein